MKKGEHFVELSQWHCSGQGVDNDEGPTENNDHSGMRGAGRKGLVPPHAGWDPQDGSYDVDIGCQSEHKWENYIKER